MNDTLSIKQPESHGDRLHAKHSPSSLKFKELCSGWTDRKDQDTKYADEGELLHEATEGKVSGDDSKFLKLNDRQQYFVQQVVDYVEPLLAGADNVIPEVRIFNTDPYLRDLTHGTPDLLILRGKACDLIDYKFGMRPVDSAETNRQGMAYALGIWDTYPDIQDIRIHFLSPRIVDGFNHGDFNRGKDYDRVFTVVDTIVRKAEADEKTYTPSWRACAYCGRKAKCEALTGFLAKHVLHTGDLELDKDKIPELLKSSTPEALGARLKVAEIAADFAEQTKKAVMHRVIEEGAEAEGYELRFSAGKTAVTDAGAVAKALAHRISVDQLLPFATVSLKSLEELICKGLGGKEKTELRKVMMAELAKGSALKQGDEQKYLFRINETK